MITVTLTADTPEEGLRVANAIAAALDAQRTRLVREPKPKPRLAVVRDDPPDSLTASGQQR